MNECIVCKKPCKGECCSGACRARKSRRTRTVKECKERTRTRRAHDEQRTEKLAKLVKPRQTALTTQKQNEHKPAQSTKSGEVMQLDKVTFVRNAVSEFAQLDPSLKGKVVIGLPGDADYNGCVPAQTDWATGATIDIKRHKPRPQPTTAAPVDEVEVKA